MRVLLLALATAAVALAGCISQSQPQPAALDPGTVPGAGITLEPVTVDWVGHVAVSQLGMLAHSADTEPHVAPVQQEGFLFEITEVPQALRVSLAWPGPGQSLVMVSSPAVDGKGVEYFTAMSGEAMQCLEVPAAEVIPGQWQVMIHTMEAANVDYTFSVTTIGGAGSILEGPHSSAEAVETTEGEALPCPEAAA